MERIIECVPNFSEGRNMDIINTIVASIEKSGGVKILDVDPGEATNRTVVTFVGSPEAVAEAAFQGVKKAGELIDMRNQGAMLSDPTVREGYVQGSIARGFEAAGSNANGSAQAFMGMGMGMGSAGNFMGAMSETNRAQMQNAPKNTNTWQCVCGHTCDGNFCPNCGAKKPNGWFCPDCGTKNEGKFCSNCGRKYEA